MRVIKHMKMKNSYLYIIIGICCGFLYALIPMYINVIFIQKIIEYALEFKINTLIKLSLLSMVVIVIAELLNSIYENVFKQELKIKIQNDVLSFYLNLLCKVDLKIINNKNEYNRLKLIEKNAFEQRIDLYDNIISIFLQLAILSSLIAFLITQNIYITVGVIIYCLIVHKIGKNINKKKLNFQHNNQKLISEKEIVTNYYLLNEYSEYIKDSDINKKAIDYFKNICTLLIYENKKLFKKTFPFNTFCIGGGNIFIEYLSLAILGYIKIVKNLISTAQFLGYYRAIDVIISGINFLSNSINKLHYNYSYLKCETIKTKIINKINNFNNLELKNIEYKIDNRLILESVSFKIELKDKIAIIGDNASGKTTLLKIIANMLNATSGEILLNNNHSNALTDISCYVPAETIFFKWEKYNDNFFNAFINNSGYNNSIKIVNKVMSFLKNSLLSEGEKKILMIMRAFSTSFPLIILDEPFSNLDEEWKNIIEDLIRYTTRTIVFSTHDVSVVKNVNKAYEIKNHICKNIQR